MKIVASYPKHQVFSTEHFSDKNLSFTHYYPIFYIHIYLKCHTKVHCILQGVKMDNSIMRIPLKDSKVLPRYWNFTNNHPDEVTKTLHFFCSCVHEPPVLMIVFFDNAELTIDTTHRNTEFVSQNIHQKIAYQVKNNPWYCMYIYLTGYRAVYYFLQGIKEYCILTGITLQLYTAITRCRTFPTIPGKNRYQ